LEAFSSSEDSDRSSQKSSYDWGNFHRFRCKMAPVRVSKKQKHHLRIRGGGGGDNGNGDGEEVVKKRRRKRHYYNYTVKQKIAIVQEAYSKPKYVANLPESKECLVTLTFVSERRC
jgi:hypothetical protein